MTSARFTSLGRLLADDDSTRRVQIYSLTGKQSTEHARSLHGAGRADTIRASAGTLPSDRIGSDYPGVRS